MRTRIKICGIKTPEAAGAIAGVADGAVVGSAIVESIGRGDAPDAVLATAVVGQANALRIGADRRVAIGRPIVIGFGAIIFLSRDNPQFFTQVVKEGKSVYEMVGGTNMAAVHLAGATGGDLLLGFISAVAFATILAVVAGLTLSGRF